MDSPFEAPPIPAEEMERAFFARDSSYDGLFFAGVKTTGIFCRPSCPARKPLPENVVYFGRAAQALFDGFRPCKRCRPLADNAAPDWVEELVAEIEADPSKRILAEDLRHRGLDPATVRRRFQSSFGLTFCAYQRARRLAAAFEGIKSGQADLNDAVFESGYESHAGFREAFGRLFGTPPGRARKNSTDFLRVSWLDTPLGGMVAGATDKGIAFLEFSDRRMMEAQAATIMRRLGLPAAPGRTESIDRLERELDEYFAGRRVAFDLPIHQPGTPFQELVWTALRTIPCGETRSYSELAHAIGYPAAVRAVARANGMNRISILVPCHRVIGADGGLGGYGGGLWRKRLLLDLECRLSVRAPTSVANLCGPLRDYPKAKAGR